MIKDEIAVLQIGLGPLGMRIAEFIAERSHLKTVAAVDKHPKLVGSIVNGVPIAASLEEALTTAKPDIAILTTVSDIQRITPQILEVVENGIPVITTCEELSFPWATDPDNARRIDDAAKANDVAILATGVNPGFLMDTLPVMLTAICRKVEKVTVNRVQDAGARRLPFQKKIGAGCSMAEFEKLVTAGTLRHVGLTESIYMIAHRLGWKLDRTEDVIDPVIAQEKIETGDITVAKGDAAGVLQTGRGYRNGEAVIELQFRAALGEAASYDEVTIAGDPAFTSRIEGGINGDTATCSIVLNAIPQVLRAGAGLKTMVDIPVVSCGN